MAKVLLGGADTWSRQASADWLAPWRRLSTVTNIQNPLSQRWLAHVTRAIDVRNVKSQQPIRYGWPEMSFPKAKTKRFNDVVGKWRWPDGKRILRILSLVLLATWGHLLLSRQSSTFHSHFRVEMNQNFRSLFCPIYQPLKWINLA